MRGPIVIFFVVLCTECIEPYNPSIIPDSLSSLVVDGYIDANGTASVKLSRAIPLNANSHTPAEKGAVVSIESSSGEIYTLTEGDSAVYTATELSISKDDNYTLHIQTKNGREYYSDEVEIYSSPMIDNLKWGVSANGESIEVYVDAHDESPDATGYYLWDCIETYEYNAPLFVGYKLVNGIISERHPGETLYTCWRTNTLPQVMLNTRTIAQNVISSKKVTSLLKGSPQLSVRYSILIKQRAINDAEYAFRTQLQRSTEQQGSLFAVIPGTVVSNVYSVSTPGEYVLGYFRGQEVSEKRLFIGHYDLPKYFQTPHSLEGCTTETSCPLMDCEFCNFGCIDANTLGNNALIVSANSDGRGNVMSYNITSSACGDCTVRGGTLIKPPFW